MAIAVEQDILRFDVTVNDVVLVEISQPEQQLNNVEPCSVLCDFPGLLDQPEKLPSCAVLQDKCQVVLAFEGELHFYNEGMLGVLHDVALVHDDLLLFVFDDHVLVD